MKKRNTADTQLSLFPDSAFSDANSVSSKSEETEKAAVLKATDIAHSKSNKGMLSEETKKQRELIKTTYNLTPLFDRLAQSSFRSGFHLHYKERIYIDEKGLDTIRQHAADFVAKRLAPAVIPNDGKQTPMRGHPVFIAQHATGCCCRGCFAKWHHIPAGRQLTLQEQDYAVNVLMTWITKEYKRGKV